MDRRDIAETAGINADDQLKKALDVIGLSYKGAVPEMIYSRATRCFEGLMEISLNTEAVKDFARRNELDIKYLVDGANFVISKMHFNPEDNFYVTLGLPESATAEEIRQRWKSLMLLYHPDKQAGDTEWVSERAKKVNEAYTVLKDETRRSEYDRKLSGAQLSGRFPSPPGRDAGGGHARPPREFSRRRGTSHGEAVMGEKIRRYLPKAMIGVYVLAAAGFLLYIYEQNRSSTLESELLAQRSHQPAEPVQASEAPPKAVPSGEEGAGTQIPRADTSVQTAERQAQPDPPLTEPERTVEGKKTGARKETAMAAASGSSSPRQQEKKGGIFSSLFRFSENRPAQEKKTGSGQNPAEQKTEQKTEEQKSPESVKPQPVVRQEAGQPAGREAKAEQAQPLKDDAVIQDEVDAFMKRYIRAYTQNDLDGFMALFSRSAVENNTMTYQDIRNAYRETFREKINYYKIQNMEIRAEGQKASVSGTYIVNRYISAEDRWVKYTGRIVWRLARENGQLKIVSTNYDK